MFDFFAVQAQGTDGGATGGATGAATSSGGIFNITEAYFTNSGFKWLLPIAKFLNNALIPIIIIVAILGAIWIIWLGVQLAKAEDSGKATEQKKRLLNVVIALISVIVFVFLLTFVATQLPSWVSGKGDSAENPFYTT